MAPSNPSLLAHQDDVNEEDHEDGNNHGGSEVSGSSQHNDRCNDDVDGRDYDNVIVLDEGDDDHCNEEKDDVTDCGGVCDGNGDYENVVVPDSVEEVGMGRHAERNHVAGPSRDCIVVDWLKGELCIRCNRGSGQLLVCSENGCPIAVHELCMNHEPKFDNAGKFFCPYCWYKQELARTKEWRRKAMIAKKELSKFISLKRNGGNDTKLADEAENMKGTSVSTMAGKMNYSDCENGLSDDQNETTHHKQEETLGVGPISKKKPDEKSISKAHGFDNVGDGDSIKEEDIEHASDSEDDQIDEEQIQPYNPSHVAIEKGNFHLSTREVSDNLDLLENNPGRMGKEKTVLPNAVGTSMTQKNIDAASKVPAIGNFEFVSPDLDTQTLGVRPMRIKRAAQKVRPQKVYTPKDPSFQPSTSAEDKEADQQGKASTAKESVLRQQSTKRIMIPTLGAEKRRRLHWTAEEEYKLKEGVQMFSTTENKNIPWRKILEFGHCVFDPTRTPSDLKDKWKNIMAKDGSKK